MVIKGFKMVGVCRSCKIFCLSLVLKKYFGFNFVILKFKYIIFVVFIFSVSFFGYCFFFEDCIFGGILW